MLTKCFMTMVAGILFATTSYAVTREECLAGCDSARDNCVRGVHSQAPKLPEAPQAPQYTCGQAPVAPNRPDYSSDEAYNSAYEAYIQAINIHNTCHNKYLYDMAEYTARYSMYINELEKYNEAIAAWPARRDRLIAECNSSREYCRAACPE